MAVLGAALLAFSAGAASYGQNFGGEEPAGGPIIYNLSPEEGAVVSQGNLPFVGATVETRRDTPIIDTSLFIDGQERNAESGGPSAYLQSVWRGVPELQGGEHTVRVTATDSAGRTGGHTWTFTVTESEIEYSRIVDNAATTARFSTSENWGRNGWNSGHYHQNYRYALPNTGYSDTADYRFDVPTDGRYAVYGWWPASEGYNTQTSIGIKTVSGWRWVSADQSENGGRWNYLGTFDMTGGDEVKVRISRWSYAEGYIVADAVKIVRR